MALILFMQLWACWSHVFAAGVAFFYGGLAQHKNVVSTIMQAFIPLAIIPIVWAIIG